MQKLVSCPLCGAKTPSKTIFVSSYRLKNKSPLALPWTRCSRCFTYFAHMVPSRDEIAQHFECTRYGHHQEHEKAEQQKIDLYKLILNIIAHYRRRPDALLDFGCGYGDFLKLASQMGYPAYGVDANALAVAKVNILNGLTAIEGWRIESAKDCNVLFDIIVLTDVLYYLPHARDDLLAAHNLLTSDGIVIMRIPNKARWLSLALALPVGKIKQNLMMNCILDHFHVASISGYKRALHLVGFKKVVVGPGAPSAPIPAMRKIGRLGYGFAQFVDKITCSKVRIDPAVLLVAFKS